MYEKITLVVLLILDIIDVVYVPPDVDMLTDEEDIDDRNMGPESTNPQDIVGTFELQNLEETSHWDSSDDETLASKRKRLLSSTSRSSLPTADWLLSQIEYTHSPVSKEIQDTENIKSELAGKTPLEIFFKFFVEEVVNMILNFTLKYAADNNRHDFQLSKEELLNFIGILLFSGYHTLPQTHLFWSNDEDKGVEIVKKCMSRNRFTSIKQNIHLSDNDQLNKDDKFSKIRPLVDILNKKNLQWGIFSFSLSIDEQMVPYFGRHSCKMFIKAKPVRFGYKLWCLCSSDGYLFYTLPYAGAQNKKYSELGLGGDVVMNLLSVVKNPLHHQIFFDNFFSSYKLFLHLKNKGFFAVGTIRENRTNNCPIENCKSSFTKNERGTYVSAYDKHSKISVVRWNDNSTVTVCSNIYNVEPLHKVKRYDRKEKKEKYVSQPNAIKQYNQFMGGVDLHDNGIANYRTRILGKKWWWPLFCNSLDSIIVNGWKLYNLVNDVKISQFDFKSYVALRLMKTEKNRLVRNIPQTLDEVRFDNVGHTVVSHTTKARKGCRVCHSHTIYLCQKCNVHLHASCFITYHRK